MQFETEMILNKYSSNISDVKNILMYLQTYPQLLEKIEIEELVKPNMIKKHIKSWSKLYYSFENKIDKSFFKPFWLPIDANSFGLFIDLSNKSYPLFETRYFFYEPYQWYKKYIIKNIYELLLFPENDTIEITDIIKYNNKERWNLIKGLLNKN